ncbi:MAG: GNAT family acetyltransferase [Dehalococcoidales bacterium]|nr:GNAT family acetyltransferase [Dehalococcoidales bacterium]
MDSIASKPDVLIRPFEPGDENAVIGLWHKCNLVRPQNNPVLDISRKMKVHPELFLVGLVKDEIIASAMGGYEGHRGWVYYLAVDPYYRNRGLGRIMMNEIEKKLLALGCPKLNLMVRNDNLSVLRFYEKIGYIKDDVISLGKRLISDNPG